MRAFCFLLLVVSGILAINAEIAENGGDPELDFEDTPGLENLEDDDDGNNDMEAKAESDPANPISYYCKYCKACKYLKRFCRITRRCSRRLLHTMRVSCSQCHYCNPRYYYQLVRRIRIRRIVRFRGWSRRRRRRRRSSRRRRRRRRRRGW